jgi:hypothetical protein
MMKRILLYLPGALGLYMRATVSTAALPTAQTVAAKWRQRASAAQQDYLEGVANTDKDPTALAIAAGPRLLANFTDAFNSGRWANGLRRTGKSGWQNGVATKGGANYANGVQAAEAKVADAFGPLLAFEQNLLNEIGSMPNVTDNDRDQRMLRWAQRMRKYQRT